MRFEVLLKGILTGIIAIVVLLLFEKVTKIELPAWLWGFISASLVALVIRKKQA